MGMWEMGRWFENSIKRTVAGFHGSRWEKMATPHLRLRALFSFPELCQLNIKSRPFFETGCRLAAPAYHSDKQTGINRSPFTCPRFFCWLYSSTAVVIENGPVNFQRNTLQSRTIILFFKIPDIPCLSFFNPRACWFIFHIRPLARKISHVYPDLCILHRFCGRSFFNSICFFIGSHSAIDGLPVCSLVIPFNSLNLVCINIEQHST